MQFFVYLFKVHPWILPLMAVSVVVWIAALVLVVRSPKFRRKWLWALLTLFSFSWSWSYGGSSLSVGIPLGALYVLGFWWLGPSPTPEQLAEDAARRASQAAPVGSRRQVMTLRFTYLAAAIGPLALAILGALGELGRLFTAFGTAGSAEFDQWMQTASYIEAGFFLAISMLFAWLAWHPYWWGKILLVWAGLAWTGFGLIGLSFGMPTLVPPVAAAAGLALVAAAVIHQIADRRFSGSYLRLAEG